MFVKVSIVLFLYRLLGCVGRFRQVATAVIIFVIAWGVTAAIGNTFQCWPVQYFWIKHIDGHCMRGQNTFYIIIGSVSVVEDVFILCLPLPIVWKLQTPLREKIEITLLFSIGCLYDALCITFRGHNANSHCLQSLHLQYPSFVGTQTLPDGQFHLWVSNFQTFKIQTL